MRTSFKTLSAFNLKNTKLQETKNYNLHWELTELNLHTRKIVRDKTISTISAIVVNLQPKKKKLCLFC